MTIRYYWRDWRLEPRACESPDWKLKHSVFLLSSKGFTPEGGMQAEATKEMYWFWRRHRHQRGQHWRRKTTVILDHLFAPSRTKKRKGDRTKPKWRSSHASAFDELVYMFKFQKQLSSSQRSFFFFVRSIVLKLNGRKCFVSSTMNGVDESICRNESCRNRWFTFAFVN